MLPAEPPHAGLWPARSSSTSGAGPSRSLGRAASVLARPPSTRRSPSTASHGDDGSQADHNGASYPQDFHAPRDSFLSSSCRADPRPQGPQSLSRSSSLITDHRLAAPLHPSFKVPTLHAAEGIPSSRGVSDGGLSSALSSRGGSNSATGYNHLAGTGNSASMMGTSLRLSLSNPSSRGPSRTNSPHPSGGVDHQQHPLTPHPHPPLSRAVLDAALRRLLLAVSLRWRYFDKWSRLPSTNYSLRWRRQALARIAASANAALVRRCYARLLRAVIRRRAVQRLPALRSRAMLRLGYHALLQWHAWSRHRRLARATGPLLLATHRAAKVALARQCWGRWRNLPARRRRQRELAEVLAVSAERRHLLQRYRLWLRRRHATRRGAVLARFGRLVLRSHVRLCLRRWMRAAIRQQLALRLEQFHLARTARRYFVVLWAKPTQNRVVACQLEARTLGALAGRAYVRWALWLRRLVLSFKEEQRALVMLLRRYYARWRRSHNRATLSYHGFMARRRTHGSAGPSSLVGPQHPYLLRDRRHGDNEGVSEKGSRSLSMLAASQDREGSPAGNDRSPSTRSGSTDTFWLSGVPTYSGYVPTRDDSRGDDSRWRGGGCGSHDTVAQRFADPATLHRAAHHIYTAADADGNESIASDEALA